MRVFIILTFFLFLFAGPSESFAQRLAGPTIKPTGTASSSALFASDSAHIASVSAEELALLEILRKENITQPEETAEKEEFLALFSTRQLDQLTPLNFVGFSVQYAVKAGVPANTIILILLLPFLATIIVFSRQILGLPSLEMLVPIALSITLIATGLTSGVILLITILLASVFARLILKRVRVMQLPKMALSMLVVTLFVFSALTLSASAGILTVKQISIFPILLLILLSDKIVSLQLTRGPKQALVITCVTLALGLFGFAILSFDFIRRFIILYPEIILILIPINILIGRYFGLRLTELYRFSELRKYANK